MDIDTQPTRHCKMPEQKAKETRAQQPTTTTKEVPEYIAELKCIFDLVEDTTSTFLDPLSYHRLSIKCEKLELNNDGTYAQPELSSCFFEPRSPALLREYPLDFEGKAQRYRYTYESFGDKIESYKKSASDSSIGLCYELNRVFYSYPRRGIDPGKNGLSYFTSWHRSGHFEEDAVFWPVYWPSLFHSHNPCWQPESAYVSRNSGNPHVMLMIRHEVEPDVTDLLRGEVLAIVAAIITRLEHFSGEHRYIPVLVLSMMGRLRGRILQAYYDGDNVVIRKTQLYCFEPLEDARKLFDIFAQHMASIPRGITRDVLLAREPVEALDQST